MPGRGHSADRPLLKRFNTTPFKSIAANTRFTLHSFQKKLSPQANGLTPLRFLNITYLQHTLPQTYRFQIFSPPTKNGPTLSVSYTVWYLEVDAPSRTANHNTEPTKKKTKQATPSSSISSSSPPKQQHQQQQQPTQAGDGDGDGDGDGQQVALYAACAFLRGTPKNTPGPPRTPPGPPRAF